MSWQLPDVPSSHQMLASLNQLLAPNICCLCDDFGLRGLDLCAACYAHLPHNYFSCHQCGVPLTTSNTNAGLLFCGRCIAGSSDIDQAVVPFLYRPPLDHLIRQLKFAECMKYSRVTGELLANAVASGNVEIPDVIVPVPIHHKRLLQRGYNQAELIARTTGRRLGIPVLNSVLTRSGHKLPQSSLGARERELNIKRAFTVANPNPIRGLRVAVIDDVYTTGATARAIATHLKKAKVTNISMWAVARTP